jgi:parallel beta-helix repeat protein
MKNLFNFRTVLGAVILVALVWACAKKEEVVPKSTEKAISAFAFNSLSPAVVGSISGNSITASVPFGTDLKLAPSITTSLKATVSPASGTVQDFSKAITYTVTAEDATTQSYTVTVSVGAAPKSSAKDITGFAFNGLSPAVACAISGTSITATLPAGTDATKLVPTITTSAKATVSPATGAAQDFSKDVAYTVTAEDGSTQVYTAKITAPPAPVVTSKTIDCNTTIPEVWEDLGDGVDYVVKCHIRLNGNTVYIIKPGVKIQFDGGDAGFTIGGTAALKMIGTAAKPIILEGKVASAGSWRGIYLQANNLENQWEYVILRHAGSISDQKAGLKLHGTGERISLKNCTFSDNTGYGIEIWDYLYADSKFTAFANNTFTNNTKSALRICSKQLGYLDSKSSYVNNGQKYIEVISNYVIEDDIVVQKLDVPYRITGRIETKQLITLNAGVVFEFTSDAMLEFGSSYKNSALIANGTAADPVKLIGYLPNTKGVWKGIGFNSGNLETKLTYCVIDGAGSAELAFREEKTSILFGDSYIGRTGRGSVTNCTISNSGGYGISYRLNDPVTLKDNTFKDNTKTDVFNIK